MNKLKSTKAITLIALVITIILLLILAGISISALTQTEIFEKTNQAKQKSKEAQENENVILGDYENIIESTGNSINNEVTEKEENLLFKMDFDNINNEDGIIINGGAIEISTDKKYASFDGSSHITITPEKIFRNSETQDITNTTLCYWIRTTINDNKSNIMCTFGTNSLNYERDVHVLTLKGNTITAGQGYATCNTSITADNIYDGKWHFIAAKYSENNSVKLFYDNLTSENSGSYTVTDKYLNIGGPNSNWDEKFKGDISNFKIYNKALSDEEINQIYNKGI